MDLWNPSTKLFTPSPEMLQLFRQKVIDPVYADPRTVGTKVLGYDVNDLRQDAIVRGMADFRKTYKWKDGPELSQADLVNAYALLIMRQHLFVTYATLHMYEPVLRNLLFRKNSDGGKRLPRFIDIGCGPATSALAFGELFREEPFDYRAIDNAEAMRNKARELWDAAKALGIIHKDSGGGPSETWGETSLPDEETAVVLNFSYLFASAALNAEMIKSLADFVGSAVESKNVSDLVLVCTNTTAWPANEKYVTLRDMLKVTTSAWRRSINYEWDGETKSAEFVCDVLLLKSRTAP